MAVARDRLLYNRGQRGSFTVTTMTFWVLSTWTEIQWFHLFKLKLRSLQGLGLQNFPIWLLHFLANQYCSHNRIVTVFNLYSESYCMNKSIVSRPKETVWVEENAHFGHFSFYFLSLLCLSGSFIKLLLFCVDSLS